MGIIIQTVPVWGTASVVRALYGLPAGKLRELAASGHVRARKLDPDSRSSRVVYRCADIGEWLDAEALNAGGRAFENRRGAGGATAGAVK